MNDNLPLLPEPHINNVPQLEDENWRAYTADQMRDYARAALAAAQPDTRSCSCHPDDDPPVPAAAQPAQDRAALAAECKMLAARYGVQISADDVGTHEWKLLCAAIDRLAAAGAQQAVPEGHLGESVQRIERLLIEALGARHPAIDDWARIRFAIRPAPAAPAAQPAEPAWVKQKAAIDAADDGNGPYLHHDGGQALWAEFFAWASDNLGQGYSLACAEGLILDPVTSWAFAGFVAGRNHAAQPADASDDALIEQAIQGHAGTREAMRWLLRVVRGEKREPLTDEQIVAIRDEHLPSQGESFDCIEFARAVVRAHGIGVDLSGGE